MLNFFRKNKINDFKEPVNKKYTDEELFQALEEDGVAVTEQEIQKARENDAEALYKIGEACYDNDKSISFSWFHKAALQNHASAQNRVGYMYQYSIGVFRDYKLAMVWYMKAASTGNVDAQYNIGGLYHCGDGVSLDYKQAMNWYLKAANNGHTDAMHDIGYLYRNGVGVTANIPTAIEWYTKAAYYGHAVAPFVLGWIYETEDEVEDLQKAFNWYQKAYGSNHPGAKSRVEILNNLGCYAEEQKGIDYWFYLCLL